MFVKITHFINPQLFWCKNKEEEDAGVEKLELALEKYVAESGDEMSAVKSADRLQRGEYVAVHRKSENKWVRAEIDVYDDPSIQPNEAIVWLTDHGYPMKESLDSIVLLNTKLKQLCRTTQSPIVQGGIAWILPVTKRISVNQVLYAFELI